MTGFNTGIDRKKQVAMGFDALLVFFLKLYKLQIGADPEAESRVERAVQPAGTSGSDRIYTLRVKHQGTWRSRRMTLGKLGANIANKSMCYRVIFDDLMVVKIPPQPIHAFNTYIECIRRDWRIARKAAPIIRCVVPSLAALLNKIPRFHHPEVQSPEEAEKRYVFLLRKEPSLQHYLKIGDSFAFFMNLAQYAFLNEKIEKLHDRTSLFSEGFLKPSDPLWETRGIDPYLMVDADPAIFEMGQLLGEYEEGIDDILMQYGCNETVPVARRRAWLRAHLSGEDRVAAEAALPESLTAGVQDYLVRFSEKHRGVLDAYQTVRRREIDRTWFERNKGKIPGILSGILMLLANLHTQGLAVRDLKPENIFIAADPDRSDQGMQDRETPELGLIDLETAIPLDADPDALEQPLRTGTPAYSTPSHLFPNPVLKDMLGDLKRIFLLQDAYAAAGLVFFAATGKTLFEKTGRLLPEIVLAAQKSSLKDRTPPELFRHAGWVFWHNAGGEWNRQRTEQEHLLKSIPVHPPEKAWGFLGDMLEKTRSELTCRITRLLSSAAFLTAAQREQLAGLNGGVIEKQIRRLENRDALADPEKQEQLLILLDALNYLKRLLESAVHYQNKLTEKGNGLFAHDLVSLLFLVSIAFMYRESWKNRNHPHFFPPCQL